MQLWKKNWGGGGESSFCFLHLTICRHILSRFAYKISLKKIVRAFFWDPMSTLIHLTFLGLIAIHFTNGTLWLTYTYNANSGDLNTTNNNVVLDS